MTYEIYRYIFLGGAALSVLMLIVSVVLFVTLKIPKVIGDLTGRTARKAIEDIRKQNEQSGDKTYRSSPVNKQRGKLTDKITKSGRLEKRAESPFGTGVITEQLTGKQPVYTSSETTVLSEETTVLSEETTVLSNETTVLEAPSMETTVLSGYAPAAPVQAVPAQPAAAAWSAEPRFTVEYEITYIHTQEVIA